MKFTGSNVALCHLPTVFNLTNNFDVENTKLRMEQYQRENRDVIQRNKAKLVRTKISDLYTSFYILNYWCAKAKNKRKPLFGPRFRGWTLGSSMTLHYQKLVVIHCRCEARFQQHLLCVLRPSDARAGGAGGAAAHGAAGQRAAAAGPAAGGAEAAADQEEEQAGSSRRTGEKRVAWMFLFPLRCFVPHGHTHTHTHAHCLRVHDCDIIKSLLPVIVVRPAIVLILRFQSLLAPLFWAAGFGSDCSCGVGCRRAIADSTLSSVFVCLRHRACWL